MVCGYLFPVNYRENEQKAADVYYGRRWEK